MSIPLFLYGADDRTHIASQSALLGYPNASHFGTNLRTFLLKTIINRFLYAKTPTGFESLLTIVINKKRHHTVSFFVYGPSDELV